MVSSILIADDEDDLRNLLSLHLRSGGFKVAQAENGLATLAACRQQQPDLLILDQNMPQMNGLEVCRTLKGNPQTARIPVIILTANGDELDRLAGLESGADDYITKPFSPRELILRIKLVLDSRNADRALLS